METEIEVDITCDPTQIDHTGLPWTFLDEAAHPDRIVEGALVITGDAEDPVLAHVASPTERPSGTKVHLEIRLYAANAGWRPRILWVGTVVH